MCPFSVTLIAKQLSTGGLSICLHGVAELDHVSEHAKFADRSFISVVTHPNHQFCEKLASRALQDVSFWGKDAWGIAWVLPVEMKATGLLSSLWRAHLARQLPSPYLTSRSAPQQQLASVSRHVPMPFTGEEPLEREESL